MALDMNKYAKMAAVERKLPIIFMINEKILSSEKWWGGMFIAAIRDIMANLAHRSVDAVMSVVSFGDEVHLWSGFKKLNQYTDKEWPEKKTSGKSVFNVALMLVKDMLEDIDTTPEGNYDPIVILVSSDEVTPGYESALNAFMEDGRFKNVQRIGVADLEWNGRNSYFSIKSDSPSTEVRKRAPNVLREFAGENIALYIDEYDCAHWCASFGWKKTEHKDDYTWFCPVLSMMELRYTENGQQYSQLVCEPEEPQTAAVLSAKLFGHLL